MIAPPPVSVGAQLLLVFQATLVLGAAWLVALVLQRGPAAFRSTLWLAALLALPALLPLRSVAPEWSLAVPVAMGLAESHHPPVLEGEGATAGAHSEGLPGVDRTVPPVGAGGQQGGVQWDGADGSGTGAGGAATTPIGPWILGLWALVAVLLGGRRVQAATLYLRRLTAHAEPVRDARALRALERAVRRLGVRRPVRLLQAPDAASPATFGAYRPAVVLPADAGSWHRGSLDHALLHEVAHVRRLDWLASWVATAVETLFWFHPGVRLAGRAFREAAERACDDMVLGCGVRPTEYARGMIDVVRRGAAASAPAPVTGALVGMARRSTLEGRIRAILDPSLSRDGRGGRGWPLGTLLVVVLAGSAAGGTLVPRVAPEPLRFTPPGDPADTLAVRWTDDELHVWEATVLGPVGFAPDSSSVVALVDGGLVRLEERAPGEGPVAGLEVRGVGGGIQTRGAFPAWDAEKLTRIPNWPEGGMREVIEQLDFWFGDEGEFEPVGPAPDGPQTGGAAGPADSTERVEGRRPTETEEREAGRPRRVESATLRDDGARAAAGRDRGSLAADRTDFFELVGERILGAVRRTAARTGRGFATTSAQREEIAALLWNRLDVTLTLTPDEKPVGRIGVEGESHLRIVRAEGLHPGDPDPDARVRIGGLDGPLPELLSTWTLRETDLGTGAGPDERAVLHDELLRAGEEVRDAWQVRLWEAIR